MISEYSSISASTSEPAMIHSTDSAVSIICWVRGCRSLVKYEAIRFFNDFAFPT